MSRKIIYNSFWMMGEKLISIFGLIFVTSFVAKYVGPEIYGQIALAMTIFQIIVVISQLGSDVIIFKRISRNEKSGRHLINATLNIRVFIYLICSAPIIIYSYIVNADTETLAFVIATFVACFIQAMDVYSIYYDARLKSKTNTLTNILGLVVSLMFRWGIAWLMLNPIWLCVPICLTPAIPYFMRLYTYNKDNSSGYLKKKNKSRYNKYILSAGTSFVLSSISVALYTRLSLLTLGVMLGQAAVGIYSVAVTLATAWSFVLNSIITSNLPSIFSETNYERVIRKAAKLLIIVTAIGTPVIIGAFFLGGGFIEYFYGPQYIPSILPMQILCVATLLSSLGTVSARYIAKFSGYLFLSKKMMLVAVFGLVFNFIFVKYYGVLGAAIASLITEFISLTLLNYFFNHGMVFTLHKRCFLYRNKTTILRG
ncbi:flippase [Klebsiella quasipneumoniae]|uniref:flippase n=1 Tax=Klebsiella quasipneumoniae TaxID=1463165 RepID=UPI00294A7D08|nr:flippase [Klebsiella quasipneumoniae]MDV5429774.1 flippase [Klebsiella quasipneumoniae]